MRLDEQVTYLEANASADQYGETTTTYSEGQTVFAAVQVSLPSEQRAGAAVEEQSTVEVVMRSDDVNALGLTHEDRLKYDGATLRISGLRTSERTGFNTLSCQRIR
jgi:head-tail adaptor